MKTVYTRKELVHYFVQSLRSDFESIQDEKNIDSKHFLYIVANERIHTFWNICRIGLDKYLYLKKIADRLYYKKNM